MIPATETMSAHVTHVERDALGRFWWWCEVPDCYRAFGPPCYRFKTEADDDAQRHEELAQARYQENAT